MEEITDLRGRKVFFLYPPHTLVWSEILSALCMAEYEVYTAQDHNALRRLLKRFSNSIVFVNIDAVLTEKQWEAWIIDIISDPDLIETDVGVLSMDRSKELKEKYQGYLKSSADFTAFTTDINRLFNQLTEILKGLGAMGRRKYLRTESSGGNSISINFAYDNGFLNGAIRDISSAGFSCFFPIDPQLRKGDIISDMQIKMHTALLRAEGVIHGVRLDDAVKIYLSAFTAKTDPHTRGQIRKYIQSVMQAKMDIELEQNAGELLPLEEVEDDSSCAI
jgi:hypothetical protein